MATASNVKIRFNTETDEGKTGSQTFSKVNAQATDENIGSVLDVLAGMQTKTVTSKQKIVTSEV